MKEFNREKIFGEVDASNKRFDSYTEEQKRKFAEDAIYMRQQREDEERQQLITIIAACTMMM